MPWALTHSHNMTDAGFWPAEYSLDGLLSLWPGEQDSCFVQKRFEIVLSDENRVNSVIIDVTTEINYRCNYRNVFLNESTM